MKTNQNRRHVPRAWVAAACACCLSNALACAGFSAREPKGFAAYDTKNPYRAVSSDGVIYRVHREDNEPEASLAFWQEALKRRMLEAGYSLVGEEEITADNTKGYALTLAAPLGQKDVTYFIAFFPRGGDLFVVEASGEVSRFAGHRDEILAAARDLTF